MTSSIISCGRSMLPMLSQRNLRLRVSKGHQKAAKHPRNVLAEYRGPVRTQGDTD